MNGCNHERHKRSEIRCSGRFLPNMWHPSRLAKTGHQSRVTLGEQTLQRCQICEQDAMTIIDFPKSSLRRIYNMLGIFSSLK